MSGEPLRKAKVVAEKAIRMLDPSDTFQIVRFSNTASCFAPKPVPATEENIRRGIAYVQSLKSGGGTMMISGLRAALQFAHDPERLRIVSFMTDGYIGNEKEILNFVAKTLGSSRIFGFGIGSSVNRYLLEAMARVGRGACAYVLGREDPSYVVEKFYGRMRHAALADIQLTGEGIVLKDVFPKAIPDLVPGRSILIAGRLQGGEKGQIQIVGRRGPQKHRIVVPVDLTSEHLGGAGRRAVGVLWARGCIMDLCDSAVAHGEKEYRRRITDLALAYNLVSPYSAFVAVDASRRTEGARGTVVPVAVPVPQGVRYDTTVQAPRTSSPPERGRRRP